MQQQRISVALHSGILLVRFFYAPIANRSLSPAWNYRDKRIILKPKHELARCSIAKHYPLKSPHFHTSPITKYFVLNGLPKWENRMKNSATSLAKFILVKWAPPLGSLSCAEINSRFCAEKEKYNFRRDTLNKPFWTHVGVKICQKICGYFSYRRQSAQVRMKRSLLSLRNTTLLWELWMVWQSCIIWHDDENRIKNKKHGHYKQCSWNRMCWSNW